MMLSASISVQTRSPPVRRAVSLKACVRAAPARCAAPPLVGFQRVAPKPVPAPRLTVVKAAAAAEEPELDGIESVLAKVVGPKMAQTAVTGVFIFLWYALNVAFNLTNKTLFKSFPFPWTVSAVHVLVGTIYCAVTYFIGFKQASFGRPITKEELKQIFGPATMHALGHIAANVSFAAVAISLTHTVKTLEPAFNVVLSQLILGQSTPVPVLLSLVPVMVGVALASAAELSFNWVGFLSAMLSNLTFGFRAVLSKKAMAGSTITGTSLYAYTTLISLAICGPLALIFEGSKLQAGAAVAIEKLGAATFWQMLLAVGLLYHLYNQFAFNTLARVSPVSHGVCNVVKRVVIIGTSVVFFGNVLTTQTKIGTAIALLGTYLYTEATKAAKAKAAAAAAAESKEE